MQIFQKENILMKVMQNILQPEGMILSCPKYLKIMIEIKIGVLEEGNIISDLKPTQTTQKISDTRKD